jgi:diguanylate cyclase (GGDEF)-like protein
LPDTPVDKAVTLAEELRKSLSQLEIQGASRVTASFGVVGYCPADNVDALINKADKIMYETKAAGRNCVRLKDFVFYGVQKRAQQKKPSK